MVKKVTRFFRLRLCWSRSVDSVLAGKMLKIMQSECNTDMRQILMYLHLSLTVDGLLIFLTYIIIDVHFLLHKEIKVNHWDKDQHNLGIALNFAFDFFF